jgi:hypothetical protein
MPCAAGRPAPGATVVTYDAATGARQVLRQGSNFVSVADHG